MNCIKLVEKQRHRIVFSATKTKLGANSVRYGQTQLRGVRPNLKLQFANSVVGIQQELNPSIC